MAKITNEQMKILINIIGACESGGQVYAKRDYSIYAGAYATTPSEVTCTLGWCCFYGYSANKLINNIYKSNPKEFEEIDSDGLIKAKLDVDWVKTKWNPTKEEADVLKKLIVTDTGKKCQDELFAESMFTFINKALEYDPNMSVSCQLMWCEIAHLGGVNCCKNRIFPRASRPLTVDSIYESLLKDQEDTSSNNQVGDKIYQSRHKKCVEWIKKYINEDNNKGELSMANYMANWSWGESGGYNQNPGVQAGESVSIRTWYSRPWDGILRYKDINVARHVAADYAKLCKSKLCGYDMAWANGRNTLYQALKANDWNMDKYIATGKLTEADCSSSVYAVWCCYVPSLREYYETTSYNDYKYHNCTTTYVMKEIWTKHGFTWLNDSKYRTSGSYQFVGDVYLNISHHTNMAINYGDATGKSQTIEYTLASAPNNVNSTATIESTTQVVNSVTTKTVNDRYEITASSLNIRSNYNTASSILGTIAKGKQVTVTSLASNGWGKVAYNGVTGWICLSYAKKIATATTTTTTDTTTTNTTPTLKGNSTDTFTISKTNTPSQTKYCVGVVKTCDTDPLNVRSWAGASYSTVSFSPLKHKTEVEVCDAIKAKSNGNTWYYVKYNGKYGFVSATYMTLK